MGKKEKASAAVRTEFLWHMVKSRWHRFDQNIITWLLYTCCFSTQTRHRSGPRAIHAHTHTHTHFQSYFSIYISFAHTWAPVFFYLLVVFVIQFYNVQCKFPSFKIKKIVPVSRNENEYRTYNNNHHHHWIRKKGLLLFPIYALLYYSIHLLKCVKDDATIHDAQYHFKIIHTLSATFWGCFSSVAAVSLNLLYNYTFLYPKKYGVRTERVHVHRLIETCWN